MWTQSGVLLQKVLQQFCVSTRRTAETCCRWFWSSFSRGFVFLSQPADLWHQHTDPVPGVNTLKQATCSVFLPPELLGCRRTTCSRVSLIVFSSSSSVRPASAISPVLLSVRTLTSPVRLSVFSGGSNGAGSRQRRHRHYYPSFLPLSSPNIQNTPSSPRHRQLHSPKRAPEPGQHFGSARGSSELLASCWDNNRLCPGFGWRLSPALLRPARLHRTLPHALRLRDVTNWRKGEKKLDQNK